MYTSRSFCTALGCMSLGWFKDWLWWWRLCIFHIKLVEIRSILSSLWMSFPLRELESMGLWRWLWWLWSSKFSRWEGRSSLFRPKGKSSFSTHHSQVPWRGHMFISSLFGTGCILSAKTERRKGHWDDLARHVLPLDQPPLVWPIVLQQVLPLGLWTLRWLL
jgi:hypothetical protein